MTWVRWKLERGITRGWSAKKRVAPKSSPSARM